MATLRQKKSVKIAREIITNKRPMMTIQDIMLEAGYKPSVAKISTKLTHSKPWERFLASIDETPIVDKWMEWAVDAKDKRVALQAGENIMKLKGRFREVLDVGIYKKREELFTE